MILCKLQNLHYHLDCYFTLPFISRNVRTIGPPSIVLFVTCTQP